MKISSMLSLCCISTSLSVALAGQARADQEVVVDVTQSEYPTYDGWFGGWASCYGVPSSNCGTATDKISYTLTAYWYNQYAYAEMVANSGYQVSTGDAAYAAIALYCYDGHGGFTWGHMDYEFNGEGEDGQPPPSEVYDACDTEFGAYEAVFTYSVEKSHSG